MPAVPPAPSASSMSQQPGRPAAANPSGDAAYRRVHARLIAIVVLSALMMLSPIAVWGAGVFAGKKDSLPGDVPMKVLLSSLFILDGKIYLAMLIYMLLIGLPGYCAVMLLCVSASLTSAAYGRRGRQVLLVICTIIAALGAYAVTAMFFPLLTLTAASTFGAFSQVGAIMFAPTVVVFAVFGILVVLMPASIALGSVVDAARAKAKPALTVSVVVVVAILLQLASPVLVSMYIMSALSSGGLEGYQAIGASYGVLLVVMLIAFIVTGTVGIFLPIIVAVRALPSGGSPARKRPIAPTVVCMVLFAVISVIWMVVWFMGSQPAIVDDKSLRAVMAWVKLVLPSVQYAMVLIASVIALVQLGRSRTRRDSQDHRARGPQSMLAPGNTMLSPGNTMLPQGMPHSAPVPPNPQG